MQNRVIGFFLVIMGAILLIVEADWANLHSFLSWSFILFVVGIFLIFFSFLQKQSHLTLLGGIFATIGISVWGFQYVEQWPRHWSIIVIMIGVTLMLQYILNQNNITLVIGIVLLLSGVFAWPGLKEITYLAPIATFTNVYWPIFIVGLGAIFIIKK
ncbi:hypothetical protein [Shimazuella alba]|uniref:DUF5668 domain-containing protein n=1 Tax=Shimazuella alba TaxID=2690964 RepID=A0A6I4W0X0_9BACL|nr:hypothetical protein [Shimazuella alba]MXQ55890.1 hypothetical protein [Shimazuella alba]